MRRRKYTYEFILSIIKEHNETGAGSKVPGSKYGINDARVAEWLKEYHVRGSESFLRDGKNKSYDSTSLLVNLMTLCSRVVFLFHCPLDGKRFRMASGFSFFLVTDY